MYMVRTKSQRNCMQLIDSIQEHHFWNAVFTGQGMYADVYVWAEGLRNRRHGADT